MSVNMYFFLQDLHLIKVWVLLWLKKNKENLLMVMDDQSLNYSHSHQCSGACTNYQCYSCKQTTKTEDKFTFKPNHIRDWQLRLVVLLCIQGTCLTNRSVNCFHSNSTGTKYCSLRKQHFIIFRILIRITFSSLLAWKKIFWIKNSSSLVLKSIL